MQQAIKLVLICANLFMHDFLLSESSLVVSQPIVFSYLNSSLLVNGMLIFLFPQKRGRSSHTNACIDNFPQLYCIRVTVKPMKNGPEPCHIAN